MLQAVSEELSKTAKQDTSTQDEGQNMCNEIFSCCHCVYQLHGIQVQALNAVVLLYLFYLLFT